MFVKPKMEIIELDVEDIIVTSPNLPGGGQGGGVIMPDDPDGF